MTNLSNMTSKMSISSEDNPRIINADTKNADAKNGAVSLSVTKVIWLGSMMLIALVGGAMTFSLENLLVFLFTTGFSLCFGHSLGMHRKLIHQSYQCPKWLEYWLVHLGVIVGLSGPFTMIRVHDLRDWAQRQPHCHPFLGHQASFWQDAWWQLFCDIKLKNPPNIQIENEVYWDAVYRWMEKYWMWQQLPLAIVLFSFGGIDWVIWGIAARVSVSVFGHWLIGHFAHNIGPQSWLVKNASVQGHNIQFTSLLTMGECWHNNHHAFPGSAKLGLEAGQWDPGWWMLILLKKAGLVWDINVPHSLTEKPSTPNQHLCQVTK